MYFHGKTIRLFFFHKHSHPCNILFFLYTYSFYFRINFVIWSLGKQKKVKTLIYYSNYSCICIFFFHIVFVFI
ncbi:hypothetical protein BY996DRAFT_3122554 [Phakopsora pachyrhizi]|nr:hypothetical protein BY996DRAFT_3122554 [Phakopsora pachyrhizi]